MYGEKVVWSTAGRPASSACQFASQPSPSVETIPIPVIQASSFSASIDRLSHQTVAHDAASIHERLSPLSGHAMELDIPP
jgi:hypothetical protein